MAINYTHWILDDMVLGFLSNCMAPENIRSWPTDRFFVASATTSAAISKRQSLLTVVSDENSKEIITTIDIKVNDETGKLLYNHFRKDRINTSSDLAEHESIAWSLTHPEEEWVLVTQDKNAALCALAELGRERKGVCDTNEFLNYLFEQELLTKKQLKSLMDSSINKRKQDNKIPQIPWRYHQLYESLS